MPVAASKRDSLQYRGRSAEYWLISRSRSVFGCAKGPPPPFDGTPLRGSFRIHGSSSHDANAATRPENPGRVCSHSSTVTFGFQILSLLSTRGSGEPVSISL